MGPERTLDPADGHYAHGSESRPAVLVAQGFFESNRLHIISISWQMRKMTTWWCGKADL
jgi:hypothetical protein